MNITSLLPKIQHHQHWMIIAASGILLLASMLHIGMSLVSSSVIVPTIAPLTSASLQQKITAPTLKLFNEQNAWSPFAVSEMDAEDARLYQAPASKLPLKVMGIVKRQQQKNSLAILANGQQQFTVAQQDRLTAYPASIARIFADRVILIHQGHYESLILERDSRS